LENPNFTGNQSRSQSPFSLAQRKRLQKKQSLWKNLSISVIVSGMIFNLSAHRRIQTENHSTPALFLDLTDKISQGDRQLVNSRYFQSFI